MKYKAGLTLLSLAMISITASAQGGPVMTQCKDDIAKFCAEKTHVNRELRECLESKKSEVTAECKAALDSTGPGKGRGQGKRAKPNP